MVSILVLPIGLSMSVPMSGVGIVATTPGDTESHSGHIATRMMVSIFLAFHEEVHVFTRETAVLKFDDPNVHVHSYNKPLSGSTTITRLVGQVLYQAKFCRDLFVYRENLDLVFISSSGTLFIVIAARLCAIHSIYRVGGVLYRQYSGSSLTQLVWIDLLKIVEKTIYYISDSIVVITSAQASELALGKARYKTYVWNHYFFDLDTFGVNRTYEERETVVGHIGLSDVKGTDKFITAIANIDEDVVDRVLIIGEGDDDDSYRSAVPECGFPVEFTGRVDRDDMPELYNSMKLFVLPSRSEGVPKVVLESMACGTPAVANNVGGVDDYINDKKNGFLMDGNDPDKIASTINSSLRNPELDSVSENARESVVENFSEEKVRQSYRQLLSELSN